MQRIEPASAYELVVDQIRRAIHMGSYIPGDKLPPERELALQLGVSRTTLREAIRVLEGEGYVESRRGARGGLMVVDQAKDERRIRPLVKEKLQEFEDLIDYREAIERAAARLAARRRREKDINTLASACEVMERGLETGRFRAADSAFHLAIAEAARNRFMRQAIEEVRAAMWMPVDQLIPRLFKSAHLHHAQILEGIRDRDPDAAEKAVIDHMETVRQDLERTSAGAERPPQATSSPPGPGPARE